MFVGGCGTGLYKYVASRVDGHFLGIGNRSIELGQAVFLVLPLQNIASVSGVIMAVGDGVEG